MRKRSISVVMFTLFLVLLNVNHSDIKASEPPINIVVIIDTSDRVSPERHPDQRERDIHILEQIVNQLDELARDVRMRGGRLEKPHRLNFTVTEQPGVDPPPLEMMSRLTIEGITKRSENPKFQKKRRALVEEIPKLYDFVQQQPQTGSDIWEWFRSQAKHHCLPNYRNRLICVSDGYLNFDINIEANRIKRTYMRVGALRSDPHAIDKIKNGEEALLPVGDFSGLDVKFLMLEIRLRKNESSGQRHIQDKNIIQAYWQTWLKAMNIEDTEFIEQPDLGILEDRIGNFIKQ